MKQISSPRRGFGWILLLVILAGVLSASAQSKTRILGITIQGNETSDAGLIRAHSGLSAGQEVTGDDIQSAMHQLWKLGLFSDVAIVEERETAEGVYVAIRVKEYPRLERTDIKGNKKLKGDDLKALITLTKGQVVQPRDLVLLKNRLQKKYEEMGYLLAEIQTNTYRSEQSGRQIVDIQIKEGTKVRIKDINFVGNQAYSEKTLRKKLKGVRRKTFLRSGEFKREKLEEDRKSLLEFYRSEGYRDAELISDSLRYSEDRRWIYLTFHLSEGKVYHYGDFTWEGNKLFATADLLTKMKVAPGDLYNSQKFSQSLADIGTKYYEKGYIYASVTPAEKIRDTNIVDIKLEIVEGSEFKVNRVYVEGNTKTKDRVVRRELVLFPGETFDVTKLQRSLREATILNYFENVEPDVLPINDNQVDVHFKVKEKSTDQANVSAGYSQRDGFIGAVGFQMNNLLGNGQQFSMDWNFGQIYRSFSLSFTEPWFRSTRTLVGASFRDTHRGGSYYGFDEDIIGGTLRLGRRLRWPDDYFRADMIYSLERTKYSNFSADFPNTRGIKKDHPMIASGVTGVLTRDSRNSAEFPSKGSVNTLQMELTGGALAGDDQFVKTSYNNQWYVSLLGQLVMANSVEAGVLDGRQIPYFDYFFMGGAGLSLGTALRGYDEREVGPQSGGYADGGKTMYKQSVEFRYPVVNNPTIFVLGFAEAGNVWGSFDQTNFSNLRRSVGVGVRLYMPLIGMIGLDYGLGLDYQDARGLRYTKWVPHFQFGRGF